MALIVQKYGGTSVGTTERILNVARRTLDVQRAGNRVVVVVSAMSGETNRLIDLATSVSSSPTGAELDVLLATGEQTTIALLAMAINGLGGQAISLTGAQAGIETDSLHSMARISRISAERVFGALDEGNIVVVAGFQGTTREGRITTLGRGGSDLSAIAMAAALKADCCQILTDVEGVFTCDPRIVPGARKIEEISYDELLEMASAGTKVMQSRSVEFAKKFGVHFEVRSSLNNKPGTMVTEETEKMEGVVVRGVSLLGNQSKVTITGVADLPGFAAKIFGALSQAHIRVDMIVQNVSHTGVTDVSFTLATEDAPRAEAALAPLLPGLAPEAGGDEVQIKTSAGIAKLSVVGIGMRSQSGVAARLFATLAEAAVNVQMISTSEILIAVTIDEAQGELAARTVHDAFGLTGETESK